MNDKTELTIACWHQRHTGKCIPIRARNFCSSQCRASLGVRIRETRGEIKAGAPRLLASPNRADLGDGLGGHGDDAVGSTDADGIGWPADERAAPSLTGGAGDRDRRVAS